MSAPREVEKAAALRPDRIPRLRPPSLSQLLQGRILPRIPPNNQTDLRNQKREITLPESRDQKDPRNQKRERTARPGTIHLMILNPALLVLVIGNPAAQTDQEMTKIVSSHLLEILETRCQPEIPHHLVVTGSQPAAWKLLEQTTTIYLPSPDQELPAPETEILAVAADPELPALPESPEPQVHHPTLEIAVHLGQHQKTRNRLAPAMAL